MTERVARVAALLCLLALVSSCEREPTLTDVNDAGTRIVTLAPHLSELVFDAGAGDMLVGVSAYSDFPPEAASIEIVSDAFTVDQERLRLLAPDIVLAWDSGTPSHVVEELRTAGYRVETIAAGNLADIGAAIRRIGRLTAREAAAEKVAVMFEREMLALREQYSAMTPITAFYQVSLKPLYTINGAHYISEILGICGATNAFAELNELAPAVSVESVVARDPEAIFAGSADGNDAFVEWRRWPHLRANRYENYFLINSDHIGRPTTRLVAATASLCESLQVARENRNAYQQAKGS
ncbi:MAG: cobalamin-binding protein [Gammaproteobacteria bacterium]|nr:cobalamin-binding protein [Gammaproteobacteria bacterium]NNC77604.1 cobalamin-binding protein [Woeseiaceae bacterium]